MTSLSAAPIVVGTDGSPAAHTAVEVAAREAAAARQALRIVYVARPESTRDDAALIVSAAAEQSRAAAPGVPVSTAVISGDPVLILRATSRAAGLIVLGEPARPAGHGGWGTLPERVAAHASCPVLVGPGYAGAGGSARRPVYPAAER
ncbi:nucleotide-binding universal stress UspA family protein [Actinoplanes campanulatus]|uniref:Nucleotide-binding universal stress UspA family protein n=1 Tax=Actinoplanes campanulatus TaxID=113559 RepID=A0A7W5ASI5_9ACTN|nr:universal stress protein [Actinoplanes campanulatus]MBB3101510.1 nucleotide-binding universal stress UspA family protein [Actinoplanes campanulatus]GGN50508.1 hypothetical protein GCM10010109_89720 [Actinoplanes campanulatus]GID42106.1 hypothetical protein Aca09nite_86120 [Actinoplanes campanulatus]